MNQFKSIINHGKILMKGFWRMTCGALTAGFVGLAVYGFATIPSEGGYVAVLNFICAALILVMALTIMYAMGGGKKKKGGFER